MFEREQNRKNELMQQLADAKDKQARAEILSKLAVLCEAEGNYEEAIKYSEMAAKFEGKELDQRLGKNLIATSEILLKQQPGRINAPSEQTHYGFQTRNEFVEGLRIVPSSEKEKYYRSHTENTEKPDKEILDQIKPFVSKGKPRTEQQESVFSGLAGFAGQLFFGAGKKESSGRDAQKNQSSIPKKSS